MSDLLTVQDLEAAKKHDTFHSEVITGKAGGVAGGSQIDYATNAVTGQVQKTLPKQMYDHENLYLQRLLSMRFTPVGNFTDGYNSLTDARQTLLYTDGRYYSWAGSFPHLVAPLTNPLSDTTNWIDRTEDQLRDEVYATTRESIRRSYAEAGFNLVDGSFERGGETTGLDDVLLCEADGKVYSWHLDETKTVPVDSSPANVGTEWIDKSTELLRSKLSDSDSNVIIAGKTASELVEKTYLTHNPVDDGAVGDGSDEYTILQTTADKAGDQDWSGKTFAISDDLVLQSDTNLRNADIKSFDVQDHYLIYSNLGDNVVISSSKFEAETTSGLNDAKAAICNNAINGNRYNVSVLDNVLRNTSWGVLCSVESGTGTIYGYIVSRNKAISDTPQTQRDGIHTVGRIVGAAINANVSINRGDAGIAANMISGYQGYGWAITGNSSVDNLVGVDASGLIKSVISGNVAWNLQDHTGSNPCFRQITYQSSVPTDVLTVGNVFHGVHTASREYDSKYDTSGASVNSAFVCNLTKHIYINASDLAIAGNTHYDMSVIRIDGTSTRLLIGTQNWLGSFDIFGSTPAKQGYVHLCRQNWNKSNAANFLPNYNTTNCFYSGKFKFEDFQSPIFCGSFATSSTSFVDVTSAVISLSEPAILVGASAIADLGTAEAQLSLYNIDTATAVANFWFNYSAGNTTNVSAYMNGPTTSGNIYHPKLPAGRYKLQFKSGAGTATLKNVYLKLWN